MVSSFLDAYSVLRNNLINDFLKVLKGCHVKSEIYHLFRFDFHLEQMVSGQFPIWRLFPQALSSRWWTRQKSQPWGQHRIKIPTQGP